MNIIYLLTEAVTIEVKGVKPERLINSLAVKGISFTDVHTNEQGCISLVVSYRNVKTVLSEASGLGLDAAVVRKRGLLRFLKKVKKRYVLLSMPAVCLLAVFYLSSFIWEIDVTGNKTVPDSVIIQALDEIGVGIGTNGLWLDNELIRSEVLLKVPKLSWMTVRVHGSRALIVVRERRDRPELIDESVPSEIIANKTGVVVKITALAGNSVISAGNTVVKGQTLITGELKDRQEEIRYVRSLGEVWARTWYEKSFLLPLKHIEKSYTGREKKHISVKLCNLRLNFYFNSGISYEYYDKITTEKRPEIMGLALPFSIVIGTYKEYEANESFIDKNIAEQLLKDRLLEWVMKEAGGAKMTDAQFEVREDKGCISVSVLSECYEQIGLNRFY